MMSIKNLREASLKSQLESHEKMLGNAALSEAEKNKIQKYIDELVAELALRKK